MAGAVALAVVLLFVVPGLVLTMGGVVSAVVARLFPGEE